MQKIIVFIILLSINGSQSYSQWTSIADYPGIATDGAPSFVIDSCAYIGGGLKSNDFYKYNSNTKSWTRLKDLPGSFIRAWAFAFAINGKGYICGGDTTSAFDVISNVYEYNPLTDDWTKKASLPIPMDGAYACSVGGKGYVFGGFDGKFALSSVYEYDPLLDKWTRKTDYPGGQAIFLAGFVIEDKIYVGMGSSNGMKGSKVLYEYNPAKDSWIQKASFIGHSRQACIGFAIYNNGYIGGGEENYSDLYTDFYTYDPELDLWTRDTTMNLSDSATTAWCSSFVIDNKAFYGLGAKFSKNGLNFSKSFFRFEPLLEIPNRNSKNQFK